MLVLVANAGSSSVKLRVLGGTGTVHAARDLPAAGEAALAAALADLLDGVPEVGAAGHRVVHGGAEYREPVVLDRRADAALARLAELAPLHNPPGLAAIHALRRLRPDLPQVACFDTAFHATLPAKAATYALPRTWRERWGIRKYGFHGLSHAWASRRAAELLGRPVEVLRLVTAHLGAGASLAAVAGGRSVDTTMGFTPLDGLVMATRGGSVDPGAVLWAQRHGGLSAEQAEAALAHQSGLLGLSGRSGDLRRVMADADAGDSDAALAYEVYVYRIQLGVAAMAAALGGLDGLVFTGGAGEASSRLRADACRGLGHLGVRPESPEPAGATGPGDRVLVAGGEGPSVLVVVAREDLEIDRQVRRLLA